jgi:hypothetical protein
MTNPIRVRTMDLKRAKPIKWAWKHRYVMSAFNLVIGNEGIGKGTLVAYTLAKLTRGKLQGSLWDTPVNVGIIGYEDSFDHVWGPRLAVVGANPKRVHSLDRDDLGQIDVANDIEFLAKTVQKHRISVLYFDQFLDNLATDADHYHAKQVRSAMSPLAAVAQELGVTVIATMHPNKRAANFRQLVQGSSAFNAVARSSLLLAEHPTDENMRVLLTAKSNYGQTGHELEFKIVSDRVSNGRVIDTSRVIGFRESGVSIDDLIEASQGSGRTTNKAQVEKIITEALVGGDWCPASEVLSDCTAQGFAERTVQRTATQMKVKKKRVGFGTDGGWWWQLSSSRARTRE